MFLIFKVEDSVMKMEPMKENKSENVNNKQWFVCQTCQQHFDTPEQFEVGILIFSFSSIY